MQKNLTKTIFLGFFLGIFTGIFTSYISNFYSEISQNIISIFSFGGEIFFKTLKMLVVPIVFFSLVSGVSNLNNITSLGRIGVRTIGIYLFTTLLAISISLSVGTILDPGSSVSVSQVESSVNLTPPPPISSVFLNIIPENPFKSLVEGNMLQVIFFAILFGACLASIKQNKILVDIVFKLNDLVLKMLEVLMTIAPLGIFCLIAKTFSSQGIESIFELLKYFLGVVIVLLIHLLIVYLPLIKLIAKVNVTLFFSALKQALLFAFSTSSSSATIPITLSNLETGLKVRKKSPLLLFHLELP